MNLPDEDIAVDKIMPQKKEKVAVVNDEGEDEEQDEVGELEDDKEFGDIEDETTVTAKPMAFMQKT